MKKRILELTLGIATLITMQCSDDDKSTVIPVVTTLEASDITPNSAVLNGKIVSNGNATITATGFVYSSVVGTPTVADEKVELSDVDGDFSELLEGLNSGTTYHMRAYATNSVGIGYGNVIDVTTGNAAPTVKDISIIGSVEVNKTITATYSYSDPEGDAESGTIFQWYVANDGTGTGEMAIAGAVTLEYTIEESQQGKYLRIGITPKASAGTVSGLEVKSAFVGGVGEATAVTFMYNNKEVTYGIINSATTGRKWLDRNLGAVDVASSVDDYANYGDLFQWGRLADGHQLVKRDGPNDSDMSGINGTTTGNVPYAYSSTDNPGHSLLIIVPNGEVPTDWRNPQNNNLWQGVDGVNNPCPSGWRIPTQTEWADEKIASIIDGYDKLRLTYTGYRGNDGTFSISDSYGVFWTSTIPSTEITQSVGIFLNEANNSYNVPRVSALSCRCIKN